MTKDRNRHVKDYLRFYLSLRHSPYFAVMINGPWGIGKSHLVKQFLKEAVRDPDKFVYISLFGLTSLDEIDSALFEAIYPLVTSKAAKIGGRIIKAALKFKGIDFDLNLKDVIDKFSPRVFVFDDLERCEMPINSVMGYINQFVTTHGLSCIVGTIRVRRFGARADW
jgi:KAP family P-loop domain